MGALVADTLGLPFVYLRNVPKDHGLENMIEGNFKPGQKVVLIEDLVSTGHNAIKAMREMQLAGGEVLGMVAMFTYKFAEATEAFRQEGLQLLSLTNFDAMLEAALETGNITDKDAQDFELWHEDPESWTPETLKID